MRYFKINCTLLAVISAFLISLPVFAGQYYMFKDKNGRTQIQDSIPSEYVKNGYKIVNDQGMTVDVVPSEREQLKMLEANQRRESETSQVEKEKAEKKEQDERLFHSFSSAEDIRQAGNKKIMAVQTQIDTTLKHIQAFENNLEKLEAQSANGGNANIDAIQNLRQSIKENTSFVERKRKEQNDIRDEYVEYIQRYQLLTIQ